MDNANRQMVVTALKSTLDGSLASARFSADFDSEAQAIEFAAKFPKAIRVSGFAAHSAGGIRGMVRVDFDFTPSKSAGAKNEASLKRIRKFFTACAAMGVGFEYRVRASNAYETREAFEAALAAEEVR